RKTDLAQTKHLLRNLPENDPVISLRLEHADAKTGAILKRETEVGSPLGFDQLLMVIVRDRLHQLLGIRRCQKRSIHRHHSAVNSKSRRLPYLKVKVGRFLVAHERQEV